MKRFFSVVVAALVLLGTPIARAQSPIGYGPLCTGALVQTCLLKGAPGQLWLFQATTTAASWVFIIDTATTPVNATVSPVLVWNASTTTVTLALDQAPLLFNVGIYAACSSTAPPTLTLATTCVFMGATR
jgi:nitrous oxidase accessory protein NosD